MTNMKKLGLSALAGSLVAFSANAAELSVAGGVELTYTDTGGNKGNEILLEGGNRLNVLEEKLRQIV